MKFNALCHLDAHKLLTGRVSIKTLLIMKLTSILLLATVLQVSANGIAQTVTISADSLSLQKIFSKIRAQKGIALFYDVDDLKNTKLVTVELKNVPLEQALKVILFGQPIKYEIEGKTVFLARIDKIPMGKTPGPEADAVPPIDIHGRILNESGEPVSASIEVKGAKFGTTSNDDGYFELRGVDNNATLIITSVNMQTLEIKVNNRTEIVINLQTRSEDLNEVVVSYGTQRQREVTGAVSSLQAVQLEDQPVGQIAQKIQGRIPGVQINQGSGTPGSGMAVRIRGAASINAGNNPLYVVDGFPIVGDLSNINPSEIENFSVLKGPSAAALYGSRASSGVVLITTKKGKQGRTSIDFNASQGFSQVPKRGRFDLMNGEEFATFLKERYEDMAIYEGYTGGVPTEYQDPSIYRGKNTNWYDVLLRDAPVSNYNLTLSVGKDNFTSATTFGYFAQQGSLINTYYKRFSLRSNNEFKVTDHIKIGINIAPSFKIAQDGSGGGVGGGSGIVDGPLGPPGQFVTDGSYSLLFSALTTAPWFSPNDQETDGTVKLKFDSPGLFTEPNWYRSISEMEDVVRSTNLLSNAYAQIDFLKFFRFKTSISLNINAANRKEFKPSTAGYIWEPPLALATAAYTTNFTYSWLAENTLEYNRTFGDHNINVLAGYSSQKYRSEYNRLTGTNFPDDAASWIDAAGLKNGNSNLNEWSLLSAFGRVNYNYKGKYLLSVFMRRDGSSRFGLDNQWGSFPSISAGWLISDENFAKNWRIISYLKLRGEYGKVGNFNIGNYTQYANLNSNNYVIGNNIVPGRSPISIGNPSLTWETTKGMDIGLDVGLFNNRVSFTFDYYRNRTSDMLYQIDIPNGSGFSSIQDNVGTFEFWGYEIGASTKNLVNAFKWTTDFNIAFNRNKVIKLGTNNTPLDGIAEVGGTGYWKTAVGNSIGLFYGYVFDGIYMTQAEFDSQPKHITSRVGTVRYKDIDKNGVIDQEDRTFIGNPNPKFIYGINNSFAYKNFDANIVISGAYGADIYASQREWSESLSGIFNLQKIVKDRWRSPDNPGKGVIQRSLNGSDALPRYNNSRWIEKASYLTVKNITIGYTIPKVTKYINRTRVYVSVQQALILTGYSGINPEASLNGLNGTRQGLDTSSYPVPRTFSLGLNLNL